MTTPKPASMFADRIVTSPQGTEAQQLPEVALAEQLHEKADSIRTQSEREITELEREISDRRKKLAEAEKLAKIGDKKAEQAKRIAAKVDSITNESATKLAETILACLELRRSKAAEGSDFDTIADQMWGIIDSVRCSLLTSDVAEGARPLVLAIESLVAACDAWERDRKAEIEDHKRSGGVRLQRWPDDSKLTEVAIKELKHTLDGTVPESAQLEKIGQLIREGVSPRQIALIRGMISPSGEGNLSALGALIDRAFAKVGYYEGAVKWSHLRRMASLDFDEAWVFRQRRLESRKNMNGNLPGQPATEAVDRPGRRVVVPRRSF